MTRLPPTDHAAYAVLDAAAARVLATAQLLARLAAAGRDDAHEPVEAARQLSARWLAPGVPGFAEELAGVLAGGGAAIAREDMHALGLGLDGAATAILRAADRLAVYALAHEPGHLPALLAPLTDAAQALAGGVAALRGPDPEAAAEAVLAACRAVRAAANAGERAMALATASLADRPVAVPADVLAVIRRKEVYDLAGLALDAVGVAGDRLAGLALKRARGGVNPIAFLLEGMGLAIR